MKKLLATLLLVVSSAVSAGVLFKYEDNGDWRTCYYRDGEKITTKTIHVSNPCPVND